MITPTSIVSGSSDKTKYLVGKDALYGVSSIDFNTNEHFNIGERVCRWTATLRELILGSIARVRYSLLWNYVVKWSTNYH